MEESVSSKISYDLTFHTYAWEQKLILPRVSCLWSNSAKCSGYFSERIYFKSIEEIEMLHRWSDKIVKQSITARFRENISWL